MDLKNRIPCAIMNQGKSMLIDKTSILSQNLGHYQIVRTGVMATLKNPIRRFSDMNKRNSFQKTIDRGSLNRQISAKSEVFRMLR